jgi:aryl-alcohol dehydrogenase-like predicted oxidoreductase
VLAQGDDIVPILGTKRRKYLEENAAALDIALIPDDLRWINTAIPQGAAVGLRYTQEMMMSISQ